MFTLLRSHRAPLASLIAVPTLLLALSACSSAPGTTTDQALAVATPSSSSASAPTAGALSGDAYTAAYHEYDLKLAQCFRDQGLDVADPPADGYLEADGPELQEAFPECSAKIGNSPVREITPEERAEWLPKNLEQAKCLRNKGYDIVEPTLEDPIFIPAEVSEEDFEECRVD